MIDQRIIQEALLKIRDYGAGYIYFFQNLGSADWIQPLWDVGFFQDPPPVRRDGTSITYVPWVESQYLARVADQRPELVVKIVQAMGDTENAFVHRDILSACLKMPTQQSNLLVPRIVRFFGRTHPYLVHSELLKLIDALAEGGQPKGALEIVEAALHFVRNANQKGALGRTASDDYLLDTEAGPRWPMHLYKDIVDQAMRSLISREPLALFTLGCRVLNKAIGLLFSLEAPQYEEGEDWSISWRPAVEEHEQNSDYRPRQLLVPLIRDAATEVLRSRTASFDALVTVLRGLKWDIFRRLYIHLCRIFPGDAGQHRIRTLLLDPKLFDNPRFKHEWSLLLKQEFKNLSEEDRASILGRIDSGFDAPSAIECYKERVGNEPSQELVDGWRRRWQRDKLSFLAQDVPAPWRQRYETLVQEVGAPDHPDFSIWSSGVITGPTSPKSGDQLVSMGVDNVVAYLRCWRPPAAEPFGESFDGLAAALEIAVKKAPRAFGGATTEFRTLPPIYIRALIRGLGEAAADKTDIPWNELLNLCKWAVMENPELAFHDGGQRNENYWYWVRGEIVRLLREMFKKESGATHFGCRGLVWDILRTLTDDPVLTREYERRHAHGRRYATLSINTVRGEAMHALFDYAEWVRRNTGAAKTENPANEILEPLTSHLDITKDPTLTVRSVYSQHLGWLQHFHRDWLKSNLVRIFPREEELRDYREVAWCTYVTYAKPSIPLFEVLSDEYENAVDNVFKVKRNEGDYDLQHPDNALGEHLVVLYWWGQFSIDDDRSLISRFFARAPQAVRKHTVEFGGRATWNTKGEVPNDILRRLQQLFEWRLACAEQSATPQLFAQELSAFGTWVYSRKFDELWSLHCLERLLALTKDLEPLSGYILDPVADMSVRHPLEAIKCLRRMVYSDGGTLTWYPETDKIKTILRAAINSGTDAAKRIAEDVQDRLVRHSLFEFRNLEK